ncbi:DUF2946 family protein [Sphingomonas caeni]|uniref:DUF2946 family protein n=1 Tax=Sphingomonas caeni TaxID=2984949 RepID=UPI002231ED3B|nr:DUF2946 family protein [Sphingomonas caeni]
MGTHQASRLSAAWLAVLAAVLFAFLSQSIVTQTHQHYDFAKLAQADGAAPQKPGKPTPGDSQNNCPICRELAHAGPVLLPAPIGLDAPATAGFWLAVTLLLGLSLTGRSHAWQSRAPPIRLQA